MRKLLKMAALSVFLLTAYGCAALLIGAGAGGVGTAVWLEGKLSQTVQAPYAKSVNAAKSAMRSLNLEVTKETKAEEVTQIKGKYTDGREIWIDIRPVTQTSSRIDIRVGAKGDKEAADKILKRIRGYL